MNITLNRKKILERCGTASVKRGEALFHKDKIQFIEYGDEACEAIVHAAEDFRVRILAGPHGTVQAECTCPSLGSFTKDCQHIAAVLTGLSACQKAGTVPLITGENESSARQLLSLFEGKPIRESRRGLHFENRREIPLNFLFHAGEGEALYLSILHGSDPLTDLPSFLSSVRKGGSCMLTASEEYDPAKHCFSPEVHAILHELIPYVREGKNSGESMQEVSPALFHRLAPLLQAGPGIRILYKGKIFKGTGHPEIKRSIEFTFTEQEGNFRLEMKGLDRTVIFRQYRIVLSADYAVLADSEDIRRLSELKAMLTETGTGYIPIAADQLELFQEKVVPGLRRLGDVKLSGRFIKTPLKAKVFLDRIGSRLLAGLEFHYDRLVIQPLENRELPAGSMVIRNTEMEDDILALMEESRFAKTEGGYFLQNEELEYEFLYHILPRLEKMAQVYATTAVRNRIVKKENGPMVRVKVKKERTNWLDYTFELTGVSEQEIKDVLQALEMKQKYYRLRSGSLLSLESREYEELQRFLKALPVQKEDIEETLSVPVVQGLRLFQDTDEGLIHEEESFRAFLRNLENPSGMPIPVPESMEHVLHGYQKTGYKWLKQLAGYGFGGILADDMGLGKTIQSLAYIVSVLDEIRNSGKPVLIVCPSSLTYNWLDECEKFAPQLRAAVIDGDSRVRKTIRERLDETDIAIISYPLLRKDIGRLKAISFHTVFFDEAQAFKNPVTQTARAVKQVQAGVKFALTGTPIENSIEELWSIFYVVFPELFLGIREYSHLTKKQIARRTSPFLLRRMKEEVLHELPGKSETLLSAELLPDQKKLYAAYLSKLKHDTLKHLDKETLRKNKIRILAGITRLRQLCCHPALFVEGYEGSSAKFEQLMQLLREAEVSGRRVLVFSQFTKMLGIIAGELAALGLSFFYLDGETQSEDRVKMCARFNGGERDVFLISLKAGGTGLNLTGADTVILYDLWWNPAVEEQAADRAHRMGQTKKVEVIKLIARGTIEEKMNELQQRKKHLIEEIISPEGYEGKLTEEDIKDLLDIEARYSP